MELRFICGSEGFINICVYVRQSAHVPQRKYVTRHHLGFQVHTLYMIPYSVLDGFSISEIECWYFYTGFNTTPSLRIKSHNSTGSIVTRKVTKENRFLLDKFVFTSCSPQRQYVTKKHTQQQQQKQKNCQ